MITILLASHPHFIYIKSEDDCLKHITPVRDRMKLKAIDEAYVLNAISRLEKRKASGPDKVSVTLVQDAAKSISYTLALIINSSLKSGVSRKSSNSYPDL